MAKQVNEARQAAKDQKAFFTKFECNGNYLPKGMEKWGGVFKSEGPTSNKRSKDMLAIMLFFGSSNEPLYKCIVDAGKMLKEAKHSG